MAFRIRIEPEAQVEIDEAVNWYESKQPGLGHEFLTYLNGYFEMLKTGICFFAVKKKPAFRELPLKRFPYVIIYEIEGNTAVIYSVFNTYRNPQKKP
jgi:hypothetical protein